jgi:hypothetical protein
VNLSNVCHFITGAMTGAVVLLFLTGGAWPQKHAESIDDYKRRLDGAPVYLDENLGQDTRALMWRMMQAHHRRDAVAEVAELGKNYSYTRIYESGPAQLASGKAVAEAISTNLYESDYMKDYKGVEAYPIAIVGNIGIQLDIERYEFADGSTRVNNILSVFEVKDGKLWRNWGFSPLTDED